MLFGADYQQPADVYSLSIVLWEIAAAPVLPPGAALGGLRGIPFSDLIKEGQGEIKKQVGR